MAQLTTTTWQQKIEWDRAHIWHPYTAFGKGPEVFPIVGADEVYLTLADGRRIIDGMASWWSVIHGYNHPRLNEAAHAQIDRMAHVMFGGLTHEPAINLAEALVDITPEPIERVFFADSGSVSVEVAIKMALQYQHARGFPKKHRLLTVRGGYHGDTFGAMAVCDPVNGMHEWFSPMLPRHFFAPAPRCGFNATWDPEDIRELEELLSAHADEIAAVILEPIVQGTGGMRFYHPQYLRELRRLCDTHQVLLILDEIATGLGRTGKMFGCEHAGITPDIMCLGKTLSAGYMTLAATLTTADVADTISARGPLMHGPTYMANPLACAVAAASISLLRESPWQERIADLEADLRLGLAPCAALPGVADVRVLGAIGVVELEAPVDMVHIQPKFVEAGVWVRPFGKLIYVMPPYIMQSDQVATLTSAIARVIGESCG